MSHAENRCQMRRQQCIDTTSRKYIHEFVYQLVILLVQSTIAEFSYLSIQNHCDLDKSVALKYHHILVVMLQPRWSVVMAKVEITKALCPPQSVEELVKDGTRSHHIVTAWTIPTGFRILLWTKLRPTVAIQMGILVVPGVTQLTRVCDGNRVLLISVQVGI